MEFKVSAPGKVILYGEHAVVYGKTAVAAALDLRTILEFKELPENEEIIKISMPKTRLYLNIPLQQFRDYFLPDKCPKFHDNHDEFYNYIQGFSNLIGWSSNQQKLSIEGILYLLLAIIQLEYLNVKSFQLHLDTSLAISAGLGSSASFAVCTATCFIHWANLQKFRDTTLTPDELRKISQIAMSCEKIMHGTPSGIDNSICTYGSIIEFKKGQELQPLLGVKRMRVLLVDTRVQRSTKSLVDKFAALKTKYPDIFLPILESIDSVSKTALSVIGKIRDLPEGISDSLTESYQELMTLMEVNQSLLATCQVSHPSLDRICEDARSYGLAAKLTGAGGGGYAYILLLPDTLNETIASLSKKLIANGYLVTLTNLGGTGVQIYN